MVVNTQEVKWVTELQKLGIIISVSSQVLNGKEGKNSRCYDENKFIIGIASQWFKR